MFIKDCNLAKYRVYSQTMFQRKTTRVCLGFSNFGALYITGLLTYAGRAHNIVVAERVVLNFMQRMSGIATLTKVRLWRCCILNFMKNTYKVRASLELNRIYE